MSSTTEVRIEQEELETIKKSVLTSSRGLLVDSIDPANHLSYLRSKFIFDEREADEICAQPSRSAKAEVFLDKLGRKGSLGYDEFQNSLCRDRTQLFLLTHMTKKLELLKHRVREFKEQQMKQYQEQLKLQRQSRPPMPQQQHQQYQQQQQRMNFAHLHMQQQRVNHSPTTVTHPIQQSSVNHQPQQQQPLRTNSHYHVIQQPIQPSSNSPRPTVLQHQQRVNHYQPQVAQYQRVQQQMSNYCQPQQHFTTSFRTVTPPQAPSHPHNNHHRHQPHLHQNPPNFHSRDPDSNTSASDDITDENSLQGSPHLLSMDSSMPCGQPCGQPS